MDLLFNLVLNNIKKNSLKLNIERERYILTIVRYKFGVDCIKIFQYLSTIVDRRSTELYSLDIFHIVQPFDDF